MKIKELQKRIADALNGDESLVQGGCKAFAEDSQSIVFDIEKALNDGGVSLVVVTPEVTRSGSGTDEGLPVELTVEIQCSERPALNREVPGHLTALDAAERVAHALDGEQFEFNAIRQFADPTTKTVTATVSFGIDILLTNNEGE